MQKQDSDSKSNEDEKNEYGQVATVESITVTPSYLLRSESIKHEIKDFIDSTTHPNIFPTDGYRVLIPNLTDNCEEGD